jgi:hypothetical protein
MRRAQAFGSAGFPAAQEWQMLADLMIITFWVRNLNLKPFFPKQVDTERKYYRGDVMKEHLQRQARLAFEAVQGMNQTHKPEEVLGALEDLTLAVKELGGVSGVRLEIKPADLAPLLKQEPRLNPKALHFHVVSSIEGDGSQIIAGIYAIPETGVLKFYTNSSEPFMDSQKIIGNENALFKEIIDHIHGCSSPPHWRDSTAPALQRMLGDWTATVETQQPVTLITPFKVRGPGG